jgi:hypothetical protein
MNNLLLEYFIWHFFEAPLNILRAWRNFLLFNLNYFSLPLLLKTLFSPWRGYQWSYGRGFDPSRYLQTFISNSFSRLLGCFLRLTLILAGIITETIILFLGGLILLGWLFLPVVLILSFVFGIKLLF